MRILGLVWVGTRTTEHPATVAFFHDVLGLGVQISEPDFAVLAWRAARRGADGPGGAGRAAFVLAAVLIVAYGVALWAMATKPA